MSSILKLINNVFFAILLQFLLTRPVFSQSTVENKKVLSVENLASVLSIDSNLAKDVIASIEFYDIEMKQLIQQPEMNLESLKSNIFFLESERRKRLLSLLGENAYYLFLKYMLGDKVQLRQSPPEIE